MAAIGVGVGACGSRQGPVVRRVGPPVALAPVEASWDRVIRTTVGLRPHRDSGFVVRSERLDAKTVVHNYGHGGAGMSISWGTGLLAAELAMAGADRRIAVIGSGVVGLTCARQLQRRGCDVTVYASAVPPDTTSNMSLAGFTPTSGLVEFDRRTDTWDAQFRRAAEIAYRQLQLLVGDQYGVSWIYQYSPAQDVRPPNTPNPKRPNLQAGLQTGRVVLDPGQHPFPTRYAIRSAQIRIEPSIYLDALMRDVVLFGGRVVVRQFETPRDLMALSESVIVNCTGLGARTLFNDEELVPLKGQLTALVPQPEVDYGTNGGLRNLPATPGIGIHMMPRRDGIILGGTSERGIWTLEPNAEERQRIVDRHIELFSAMRPMVGGDRTARLDLPTEAPPLESFFDEEFGE
jgi:glycine/D-amino acid oxidase-like deaminating enzyme